MDWKHIVIGLGLVVGTSAVHYLTGVNWSTLGVYSPVIGGVLSIANEILTGASK